MSYVRELPPMPFDFVIVNSDQAYFWEPQWHAVTGIDSVDFMVDARNRNLGGGAAISIKPAVQLAEIRTDRPDAGALITAGSAITGNGLTHYQETLSAASKFFFRRGMGYKLTSGSFAQVQGILYTSFLNLGTILPAEEVVFNPTNDVNTTSYFPLNGGRPLPAIGVDKAKAVIVGLNNQTTTMDNRLAARVFNDPLARGSWTDLEAGWNTPASGDFERNTGEVSLGGLTPGNCQWLELALAVRKGNNADPNSRCIFHIIPALKYT